MNIPLPSAPTPAARGAERYAIRLVCPDRPGVVAAVTGALFECGANILEAQQYNDVESDRFFARISFALADLDARAAVESRLAGLAGPLSLEWDIRPLDARSRVLILVSRFDHCLADLLYRWRTGDLSMDVVGIVANHPRETYRHLDFDGIPFHHLPVTAETKDRQEADVWRIFEASGAELVVLARYMQILSDELSSRLQGRCINIHHSFLPGFKGAKPYHQAHARGVKLIGATAHYVTADLDEGPIIEQDVERVTHTDSPQSLVCKGRDIERRVLSRAVGWHLDGRVLLNGHKTVVFKD